MLLYSLAGFYLVPYLAWSSLEKSLNSSFQTKATVKKLSFNPYTFELEALDFNLPDKDGKSRFSFERLYLNLELFPLITKEIQLKSFFLGGADGQFIIFKNGMTNWATKKETNEDKNIAEESQNSSPWGLSLNLIQIEKSKYLFIDETQRDSLRLPLGPIELTARNISTEIGKNSNIDNLYFSLENQGYLKLSGDMSFTPFKSLLYFEASKLPMDFITSYLSNSTYLMVDKGHMNLKGKLNYENGKFSLLGSASAHHVDFKNSLSKETAFKFDNLILSEVDLALAPFKLHINDVELDGLVTTIVLNKDGTLNYSKFTRPTPEKSNPDQTDKKPLDFVMKKFRINKGSLNFSDQQIKPKFEAHIKDLNGSLVPLSFMTDTRLNINLDGKIESHGIFKAKGFIIPAKEKRDMKLGVSFNNIEMTTFTPYSGRFMGYEIYKGKLFLDLDYTLKNNRIKGQNQVRLDQFTLGEEIESDKSTNLPVRFLLSLMKDRKGQIKFKLPIEGDVNSPTFSFSNLIWTTLKNMLLNIIAAPFDFLASLFDGDANLQMIEFSAGQFEIKEDQLKKIDILAKILEERPNLKLEVEGHYQKSDFDLNTDEIYLKDLSLKRGQAVQTALVARNIDAERVYLLAGVGSHVEELKPFVKIILSHK